MFLLLLPDFFVMFVISKWLNISFSLFICIHMLLMTFGSKYILFQICLAVLQEEIHNLYGENRQKNR